MKLVKMSLLAATLIASSAFAIDNIKVDGDAKLNYATWDAGDDASLFNQNDAAGQAAVRVGITADLTEGISAGATGYALTSLGLYNNLVSNIWETSAGNGNNLNNAAYIGEAWLAGTVGKTTGKVGYMELDTPMVYSEHWSIAPNTFGAAVLINQDIPDTTLVGAFVGQSNGFATAIQTNNLQATVRPATPATGYGVVLNENASMESFYTGAYTAGAVNNSWEPLTVQAWYYQAQSVMNSYWLQADLNIIGLDFGLQYTAQDFGGVIATAETESVVAAKIGYEMKDAFTVSAAFSQVAAKNGLGNVGMNLATLGQSKLYTEAWWNYAYVTLSDTTSINVTATTPEELTYVALGAYFTQATVGENGTGVDQKSDMMEVTLEASKSFGPLDVSLLYILTDAEDQNPDATTGEGQSYNTVQAYLTYNF